MNCIVKVPVACVMADKGDRAEIVTQLLFGEMVRVDDEDRNWLQVFVFNKAGFIKKSDVIEVSDEYVSRYLTSPQIRSFEPLTIAVTPGDADMLLQSGSVLPFYDDDKLEFKMGDDTYKLQSHLAEVAMDTTMDIVVRSALLYLNTPFYKGGRSHECIDDAALVQLAYSIAGIEVPRFIEDLQKCGDDLMFVDESDTGDLLFFGDNDMITHVGIKWGANRIIHTAGRVRVDIVDHQGVFNSSMNRYSHNLKMIKRIVL